MDAFSDLLNIPFKGTHLHFIVFSFQTHDFEAACALLYSLRKAVNY